MSTITGYVDLQVNGHCGVDFSSPQLTGEDVIRATEQLLAAGTTVFLPTLITAPPELYRRNVRLIREAVENAGLHKHVPGVHLEGPFLSPSPGAVGCHNPAFIQSPSPAFLDSLLAEAGDFVRLLTVAADQLSAEDLIRHAVGKGIAVSLGHHLADAGQIRCAADAGAVALTHLGNGIPNLLDRHRNPIWAGLSEERLTAMIITDGHHLPPELIKVMIRAKGVDKVIVVSDASPITGFPPGRYHTLGNDAILETNGRFHNPTKGCLVGSASTMKQCMNYLASLEILSAEELAQVGYYNPLRLIGCNYKI